MGTDSDRCRNCKFFKTYYHGQDEQTGMHVFSYVCGWTLKRNDDINPKECNKPDEYNRED